MIEEVSGEARAEGRGVLILDSGDSLYRGVVPEEPASTPARRSATAIVKAMGQMGYAAMAVGPKDLIGGYDDLLSASQDAGIRLLAANLRVSGGRFPFRPHEIVEVGGRRVGIIGLATADHSVQAAEIFRAAGVMATDPVEAARAAVEEISSDVDLVIILANLSQGEALAIGREVEGAHLLLGSGTGRILLAEEHEHLLRYEPGNRGQFVLQLDVAAEAGGRLVDRRSRRGEPDAGEANVSSMTHALLPDVASDAKIDSLVSELK